MFHIIPLQNFVNVRLLGQSKKSFAPISVNFDTKNISGFPHILYIKLLGQEILDVLQKSNFIANKQNVIYIEL